MFLLLAVAAQTVTVGDLALGRPCEVTTVRSVTRDGDKTAPLVLTTGSGRRLRVYGSDFINVDVWASGDALQICAQPKSRHDFEITDIARGEKIVAREISNKLTAGENPDCLTSFSAHAAPADVLDRLDRFRADLAASDLKRLDMALPRSSNGGVAKCDQVEGSRASCEVAAYMAALRVTGLSARYQAAICQEQGGTL